mgnify:CR=1 FL=1
MPRIAHLDDEAPANHGTTARAGLRVVALALRQAVVKSCDCLALLGVGAASGALGGATGLTGPVMILFKLSGQGSAAEVRALVSQWEEAGEEKLLAGLQAKYNDDPRKYPAKRCAPASGGGLGEGITVCATAGAGEMMGRWIFSSAGSATTAIRSSHRGCCFAAWTRSWPSGWSTFLMI